MGASESGTSDSIQKNVIKPETEAVPVSVQPIRTQGADCKDDKECLAQKLNDCQKARGSVEGTTASFELEIEPSTNASTCQLTLNYESAPQPALVGKSAVCELTQTGFTAASLTTFLENNELIKAQCTGDAVDRLRDLDEKAKIDAERAVQNQRIADLQKQLENLSTQPAVSTEQNVRPAATENTAEFRRNTNTVTQTPADVLRQNQASGSQVIRVQPTGATTQVNTFVQPANPYSAQLGNVNRTPETGPADMAIVALLITMAVMGGKKVILKR
ncbi:hypothetical protein IPJ72_05880 [Candidatus Peregrinibacteria bacterium]|nr:MAG: hypothetical protein IPJ72_05880 [Candidatus Peregrinibacteria bacterium]